MSETGPQEVVMFLDGELDIVEEMFLHDFETLLSGSRRLERYAASKIKAVYCIVGNGLSLRGAVFFQLNVDEEGVPDAAFNLPLRYLAQQAGVGADLGQGGVRIASRGKCPVPWHSVNLWEPEDAMIEQVQRRIFRNKLRLPATCGFRDDEFFVGGEERLTLLESDTNGAESENGCADVPELQDSSPMAGNGARSAAFSARLNEVFGAAGKLSLQDLIRLHSEQLNQAKAKYREDVEAQQLVYLDQLRAAREEIHSLKVALRQEQSRNRRLQQMLRGDI